MAVRESHTKEVPPRDRRIVVSPLRKRVHALSKGYSRRLMLALALLTPHPLLLVDGPFDGFDLRQTREIMTVLRVVARNGRTLVSVPGTMRATMSALSPLLEHERT